jgi:hypothetical protein
MRQLKNLRDDRVRTHFPNPTWDSISKMANSG